MKSKWISMVLTALAVAGLTVYPAYADDTSAEMTHIEYGESEGGLINYSGNEALLDQPLSSADTDGLVGAVSEEQYEADAYAAITADQTLASSYRPAQIPQVISQRELDLCWTYAAIDSSETNRLLDGMITDTSNLYSPGHLGYAAYHGGDETWTVGMAGKTWYSLGGNALVSLSTLLRWYGLASSSVYETTSSLTLGTDDLTSSLTHLTGYEQLKNPYVYSPDSGTEYAGDSGSLAALIEEMKEEIVSTGSLIADLSNTSYSADTSSYFTSRYAVPNHEEAIIGWDDSKVTGASRPGAFLLMNSYGTGRGEGGLDWISYYDASLCNVYALHYEKESDGTHEDTILHSYDGLGYGTTVPGFMAANIFTASENEKLDRVGIYVPAGGSYTVSVRTGVTAGSPMSGTEAAVVSGSETYMGFYTIPLGQKVSVRAGENFSIIATVRDSSGNLIDFCEQKSRLDMFGNSTLSTTLARTITDAAGESYRSADGGMTWLDNYSEQYDETYMGMNYVNMLGNNCIKAYANADNTAPETVQSVDMYRLYNPNSGEPFYTGSPEERNHLETLGWRYEGIGWKAPKSGGRPVYRMYNPNAGDHHYTTSAEERDWLKTKGWRYEGVGWQSADSSGVPVYRLYNPNCTGAGAHHYTTSAKESEWLVTLGWRLEGIGWNGVR